MSENIKPTSADGEKATKQVQLKNIQPTARIGGKGTVRRKKIVVRREKSVDEKKVQSTCKKLNCKQLPGVDEVAMFLDDRTVIHFTNPKVQISFESNMYSISGANEEQPLLAHFPRLVHQMGREQLRAVYELKTVKGFDDPDSYSYVEPAARDNDGDFISADDGEDDADDEIPTLIEDFEAASIAE